MTYTSDEIDSLTGRANDLLDELRDILRTMNGMLQGITGVPADPDAARPEGESEQGQ